MSRARMIVAVVLLAVFVAIVAAVMLLWPRPEKPAQVDKGRETTQPTFQAAAPSPSASSSSVPTKELQALEESLNSKEEAVQASVLEQEFAAALQEAGVPLVPERTKVKLLPETFVPHGDNAQVQAEVR